VSKYSRFEGLTIDKCVRLIGREPINPQEVRPQGDSQDGYQIEAGPFVLIAQYQ